MIGPVCCVLRIADLVGKGTGTTAQCCQPACKTGKVQLANGKYAARAHKTKVHGMTEGRSREQGVSAPGTRKISLGMYFRGDNAIVLSSATKMGDSLDEMLEEMEMRRGGGGGGGGG